MKDRVQSVIEQIGQVLEKGGYLPREVTFSADVTTKTHSDIDINKINFEPWKTLEFWEQRMPEGLLDQFPCLQYMVEEMLEKNKDNSPLKELEQRRLMVEGKYYITGEDDKLIKIDNNDACRQLKQLMKDEHKEIYHNQLEYEIKRLEENIELHKKTEQFFTGLNPNYVDELSMQIEELKAELHA